MALGVGSLIALSLGSSAINGLTNYFSQKDAQKFNAEQAALQRQFEERMSNTAYQRSVADMREAGLNSAMMLGNGSQASTPTAHSASTVPMRYNFGDMFSSAVAWVLNKDKQAFKQVHDKFMEDARSTAKLYLSDRIRTNREKYYDYVSSKKKAKGKSDGDENGGLMPFDDYMRLYN